MNTQILKMMILYSLFLFSKTSFLPWLFCSTVHSFIFAKAKVVH